MELIQINRCARKICLLRPFQDCSNYYCCITNYSNLVILKHFFKFCSQSCGSEIWKGLILLRFFHISAVKCWLVLQNCVSLTGWTCQITYSQDWHLLLVFSLELIQTTKLDCLYMAFPLCWSQGGWTFYTTPKVSFPAHEIEAALPFMIQPQKSHRITLPYSIGSM